MGINCMAARQKSRPPAFLSFLFYSFPSHMPLWANKIIILDTSHFTLQQEKHTSEAVMYSRQIFLAINTLSSCLWQKFGQYHVLGGARGDQMGFLQL